MKAVFVFITLVATACAWKYVDPMSPGLVRNPGPTPRHVVSAIPQTYVKDSDLPQNFAWSNVNGTNFMSFSRQQHAPQYCGSCWAMSTTSAMNDRLSIMNKGKWAEVDIAPQVLVSCGNAGNCQGGDPDAAMAWIMSNGITDEQCAPYQAQNLQCTPEAVCKNCQPGGKCEAVPTAKKYYFAEHGQVSGESNMQKEIFARGPIVCGMCVTADFETYTGGVYVDKSGATCENHAISVYGWGVDQQSGLPYWNVRNSWGTFFGEQGTFRILRGKNNLGIENNCSWGVPKDPSTY